MDKEVAAAVTKKPLDMTAAAKLSNRINITRGLGVASVLAHGWVLLEHSHGLTMGVLMLVMTAWCAVCTIELFLKSSEHCLKRLCLMSLAMVLVHATMIAGFPGIGSGHQHGAETTPEASGSQGETLAMLAIILIELLLAFACGAALRAGRACSQQKQLLMLRA